MRVAGVRLPDGRVVWADAEAWPMSPLDTAVVRLSEGEVAGSVFVSPEQLIQPPERVDGVVVEIRPREIPEERCGDLPGSDLPYLGSTARAETIKGRVTALDPVKRLVTLTRDDGSEVEVPASEILPEQT